MIYLRCTHCTIGNIRRVLMGMLMLLSCAVPQSLLAHEAYVEPRDVFWEQWHASLNFHALSAWHSHHNVVITLKVVTGILVLLTLNFLFRRSSAGQAFNKWFERFATIGPLFVRVTIAVALFFSALSMSFLGPELELTAMPWSSAIRFALFAMSIMILLGICTELAAAMGLIIFLIAFGTFGSYLLTYTNYIGEFIVLLLFGMRFWSIDTPMLGTLSGWRKQYEKYETTIVRIFYGFALIYAGITVKLLHPELTVKVVTDWNLTQFHWLFPADPLLVTLGAGIAEIVIGLFILIGFELRLTVFISLFYITLSLLYFRELVWPHLILYGISFNLIVQKEVFTLDHLLFAHHRKAKRWWLRSFLPHRL